MYDRNSVCLIVVPLQDTVGKKSPYKVFIGQCTEDLTEDVLREYFAQFGEISDLYVPKPFRAFAFVTFVESNAAKTVCAQEHQINETKVYVTEAVPKGETDKYERGGGGGGGGGGGRGSSRSFGSKGGSGGGGGGKRGGGGDYYGGGGGGGGGGYDDYYDDRRRPWPPSGGREDSWRDRWQDEPPSYKDNSWRSAKSGGGGGGWSGASGGGGGNRWRDSGASSAADPNIDPDVVAQVVNKAVLGVIGNLKGGGHSAPVGELAANGGGGYGGKKDEWWSRR